MIELIPSPGYLVLEAVEEETVSKTGFIVSTSDKTEKPSRGKIVKVPKGSEFQVGDIAIFKKYVTESIEIDETVYLFLREGDIMAVLRQE